MPLELSPLVDAINEYAIRLERHTSVQQSFIQNAAHQLRTPLTLLTTQVSYAIRAIGAGGTFRIAGGDPPDRSAIRAAREPTADALECRGPRTSGDLQGEPGHLDEVVRGVLVDMAGRAQSKGIDLGFESTAIDVRVQGHAVTLREIVMNLVDNAIRYTQAGGVVTTRIVADAQSVVLGRRGQRAWHCAGRARTRVPALLSHRRQRLRWLWTGVGDREGIRDGAWCERGVAYAGERRRRCRTDRLRTAAPLRRAHRPLSSRPGDTVRARVHRALKSRSDRPSGSADGTSRQRAP